MYSSNIFGENEMGRASEHVAPIREKRGAYRVLVGKCEGIRPLGRSRRRWEDNNKMDIR